MEYYVPKENHEKSTQTNLICETTEVKYPSNVLYTPFVLKSIYKNNYDSLYLKNVFNKNKDCNDYNNYNNNIPLILDDGPQTQSLFQ